MSFDEECVACTIIALERLADRIDGLGLAQLTAQEHLIVFDETEPA